MAAMQTPPSSVLHDVLPLIADREQRHPEVYPAESVRALFDAGIIAGPFAEELGGRRTTLVEAVSVVEEIASVSPSVALIVSMPLGLAGIYGLGSEIAPPAQRAAFARPVIFPVDASRRSIRRRVAPSRGGHRSSKGKPSSSTTIIPKRT